MDFYREVLDRDEWDNENKKNTHALIAKRTYPSVKTGRLKSSSMQKSTLIVYMSDTAVCTHNAKIITVYIYICNKDDVCAHTV